VNQVPRVGVLAVGCVTPLGDDPTTVRSALRAGRSALAPHAPLADLPEPRAAVVPGPDLGPWLKRKKDARLLARAVALALPAAGRALAGFAGNVEELGIYVAVGREPPDEGDAEPALAAMAVDGRIDRGRVGNEGRALYPPLLPLRTLPNMALAHVAIQHGIRGENGTYAGGAEAGVRAYLAAVRAVEEGRVPYALAGAAFSAVDLASARDRLREGADDPPGEAACFVLVGPRGVPLPDAPGLRASLGDCGPVDALWGALFVEGA
jgi:3-oxoacyl-(acyl-carrier-protein) synthase